MKSSLQLPEKPERDLTPQEIETYERDGVILLRGALPQRWQDKAAAQINELIANPRPQTYQLSDPDKGFVMDVRQWMVNDDIRDVYFGSPLAYLVQQAMRSERLNLFFDQTFVKLGGETPPTDWHQDTAYWPVSGRQVCSTWFPVEGPVTEESSGLRFVTGSHKWPQTFRANAVGGSAAFSNPEHEPMPDIDADPERYKVVSWDMEPGDVLLFQANIVHATFGNRRPDMPRKTTTLRWVGDDARFVETDYTTPYPFADLPPQGGAFGGWIFPQILPERIDSECAHRDSGPILPDQAKLAVYHQRFAQRKTAAR